MQNAENPQHRMTLTAKRYVQIVRAFKSPQMRTGRQLFRLTLVLWTGDFVKSMKHKIDQTGTD